MGKYDITSGLSEYKSQAFDPGIENFRDIAKIYRETYDKNTEATNLMYKAINQMDLAEGDEDLRDMFRDNINSKLGNVLETGDYLNATSGVNDAYRYITSDMIVIKAQKNAAERAKDKMFEQQYGKSGVIDFNDGMGSTFKTLNEDGSLNTYTSNMEIRKDTDAKMKELIGNIASSTTGSIFGYEDVNGDDVMDYLKYGSAQGVSQQKMERVVDGLLNNYLNSEEGEQDYRRLTQTGQKMTDLGAKQDIKRRFRAVGQSQVGVTQNVQYKLTPQGNTFSGGIGVEGGSMIMSNVAEAMQKGEYYLGSEGFATMYNTKTDSDGSVPFLTSKESPIIFNYTKLFSEKDKEDIISTPEVLNSVQKNNLTTDYNTIIEASMNTLSMQEQGTSPKEALAYFYGETGFTGTYKEMDNLIKGVALNVGQSRLGNLGAVLNNVSVRGKFMPAGNAKIVGVSHMTQEGRMVISKEELNRIAGKAGLSDVGSLLFGYSFGDDIDNIEDAQGNKIFRSIGDDMYEFDMYTAPQNLTAGGTGSNFERLDKSNELYSKNEASIKAQVANQAQISMITSDMLANASQLKIPYQATSALKQQFITNPELIYSYQANPNDFLLRFNAVVEGRVDYNTFLNEEVNRGKQLIKK
jgi:hypothetical protein